MKGVAVVPSRKEGNLTKIINLLKNFLVYPA